VIKSNDIPRGEEEWLAQNLGVNEQFGGIAPPFGHVGRFGIFEPSEFGGAKAPGPPGGNASV
jgi:hypothetical protein